MEMMQSAVDMLGSWSKLLLPCCFNCSRVVVKDFAVHLSLMLCDWNPACLSSFKSSMIGMASLYAYGSPVYSASMVERATSVANLLFHTTGHPLYQMMKPYREQAVSLSCVSLGSQLPAKSESTKTSSPRSGLGLNVIPLSLVPLRYQASQRTASACSFFGLEEKRAH